MRWIGLGPGNVVTGDEGVVWNPVKREEIARDGGAIAGHDSNPYARIAQCLKQRSRTGDREGMRALFDLDPDEGLPWEQT